MTILSSGHCLVGFIGSVVVCLAASAKYMVEKL